MTYQRRQPVQPALDETICKERFGVCIRKTNYRASQEDRVSTILNNLIWQLGDTGLKKLQIASSSCHNGEQMVLSYLLVVI